VYIIRIGRNERMAYGTQRHNLETMTCTKLKQESENERKQSPQTQHSLDK
jgi:hypothetical protein